MTSQLNPAQKGAQNSPRRENVEAILPLLPLQKAMLLHMDVRDPAAGFLQVRTTIEGPLDLLAFRAAWEAVVARHPALRMSVHAVKGKDPMAVLWRSVALPWQVHDVEGNRRRADFLDELLVADREAGLDTSRAPTSRINLVRYSSDRHELVWTTHHLFLDGWSTAIVLEDVMALYNSSMDGSTPPSVHRNADLLRSFHASSTRRPSNESREFWRHKFAGFEGLPRLRSSGIDKSANRHSALLDRETSESLDRLARQHRLTANSLAQAAWAITLSRYFESDDVAFGTTVAGRSLDDGLERLVGYLANVVPVRVRVARDEGLADWLRALRDEQFESQRYERVPLAEIHRTSGLSEGRPLFETFMVFENFPAELGNQGPIKMSGFRSDMTSAYPLTLAIIPEREWIIHSQFDPQRIDKSVVTALIEDMKRTLAAMTHPQHRSVSDVLLGSGPARLTFHSEVASRAPRSKQAPPINDQERRMLRIWLDVLHISDIGVDEDYFDVGGTSVLALELFERIEEEFGVRLPLSTLISSSTVAQLAAQVGNNVTNALGEFRCLVPFSTVGSEPPIVCIHAGGAHVLFYRELAEQLGKDQPVYGMEPIGLDGTVKPLESIQEMAALYKSELLRACPDGPYRLVGYCLGATIGLEMARQLEEAGHSVELLAVLDTGPPIEPEGLDRPLVKVHRRYQQRGISGVIRLLVGRFAVRGRRIFRKVTRSESGQRRTAQELVQRGSQRAAFRYKAEPVATPILLVRSSEYVQTEQKQFHLDWDQLTPRFDVVVIEGFHERMLFSPEVHQVASAIKARLADH